MKSLFKSASFLSFILNSVEIGIVIHDSNGDIIEINDQACKLIGYSKEKLIQKFSSTSSWPALKQDGSTFKKEELPVMLALKTGNPQCNVLLGIETSHDGVKWLSVNSEKFEEKGKTYAFSTLKDMTDVVETKSNLNAIISSFEDVAFEVDERGIILNVWANDMANVGYGRNEVLNNPITNFISKPNKQDFADSIAETVSTGKPIQKEYHSVDGANKGRWFLVKYRLSDPVKKRVVIFISNISEQKKSVLEIASLRERVLMAAQAGGVGFWEWDIKNNVLHWDETMYELYGVEKGTFPAVYDVWKNYVHPDDIGSAEKELFSAIEGKREFATEFRILRPDGQIRYIKVSSRTERDSEKNVVKIIGANWDVTEEKKLLNALKESEDKFRLAFTNASAGLTISNVDGYWIEVNDALSQILGYGRDELLNISFQQVAHPEDLSKSLDDMRRLQSGEADSFTSEKRYIHKEGHTVWTIISVSAVRDVHDEIKFFIAQIVDITKRKELLLQLETKNQILKTTALDLENKIAQLEEFNSIIAHNVRGPVSSLVQLCDFMGSQHSGEKQDQLISMIRKTSESILDTLNDLKEVVQIQMNKDILFEKCSFEEVINHIELLLQAPLINKRATIERELKVDTIRYPKPYLENILYNLISNAIKYSKENEPPHIQISTYEFKDRIILSVKDNGLGIDLSKYGNQIFNYKKTFHEGFDSTGIGLFIVKNQIETFGGKITVTSEPQEGATFVVAFKKNNVKDYLN